MARKWAIQGATGNGPGKGPFRLQPERGLGPFIQAATGKGPFIQAATGKGPFI